MAITKSPTLTELIITEGKPQRRPKGQVIQTTGGQNNANLNLIASGYIKRYLISNDGSIAIEAIYGAKDVFSLTLVYKTLFDQLLYEGPETYYFETMTDCMIYSMNVSILQKYIEKNPLLYRGLLVEAGKRLHTAIQGLENIAMKGAYNRTAHQLLYFGRKFGTKTAKGIEVDLPLTHQDMADTLSLTRETVSVSFATLRKKGLINSNKKICLLDMERLEEEAYS